jgi:hypothetical protein
MHSFLLDILVLTEEGQAQPTLVLQVLDFDHFNSCATIWHFGQLIIHVYEHLRQHIADILSM